MTVGGFKGGYSPKIGFPKTRQGYSKSERRCAHRQRFGRHLASVWLLEALFTKGVFLEVFKNRGRLEELLEPENGGHGDDISAPLPL